MQQATISSSALERFQRPALILGVVGAVVCGVGAFLGFERFLQSYLFAYMFWLGISLGGLIWVMIHHTVGGRWGLGTRRIYEAAANVVPLMAVLFIPVLIGIPTIYEWAQPDIVSKDPIIADKSPYLNVPFFIVRVVVYFGVWILFSYLLNKWSLEQERTGSEAATLKMRRLSAPGILVYALTVNFAATDWLMSLEPHWFSTMYGVIIAVGQMSSALALATIVLIRLVQTKVVTAKEVSVGHFHDLGKLMFAFVVLWTYTSFSQFVITWSGNLPEFTAWYYYRLQGGWEIFFPILAIFHFVFPFFFLISRSTKRHLPALAFICAFMLIIRLADLFWIIIPAFQYGEGEEAHHLVFHWLDVVSLLAIGGLWTWYFARQLKNRPLLITKDPRMEELYGGEHAAHHA